MPQPATRARPIGCPGYSETLPRAPESAGTARRLVRVACAVWGLEQLAEDGALIVSELVANAAQHARSPHIRVTITRIEVAKVRIGVVDRSTRLPVPRESNIEEESGRGLALVGELATEWGADPLPWGKRVWAELHRKE
ncbi:ATP-binding protein [Streptomyces sp. NPDC006706]|uniref:ATP-binding protein n=1 Tax=Streptomyces sp. NPDC006706 TaxID=3364761 RepID=UPI00368408D4